MNSNKLIYQCHDEMGPIQIFEDGITRSLHFGSRSRQSSMLLIDPTILVLSYTRAIQTSLIFHDNPKKILLLGHGGGSLAKFYLRHFPDSYLDVVELRQKVVDVSQQFFHVPQQHPKFRFHIADALQYIRDYQHSDYDLIIVDAFTEQGLAESVHNDDFFKLCRQKLTDTGILCTNIWTSHAKTYQALLHQLARHFADDAIYQIPVRERGNSILMALSEPSSLSQAEIRQRSQNLHHRFGLEFPTFLQDIYRPLIENSPDVDNFSRETLKD